MNRLINWLTTHFNNARNWWNNNQQNIAEDIQILGSGFDRISRNITRLVIIGVIINVISSNFYPEFPERFPAIYGWFDGWLQLGEFALKAALNGIYSLFTGHWSQFWTEYNDAFRELLQQFTNWLSNICF